MNNTNDNEETGRKETLHDDIKQTAQEMPEGEKAILAARKRQAEEEAAMIQDYEERRRREREKEEAELKTLKEKKERRRLEREEEERQFEERRRLEEEARRHEEEELKARMEADRRRKEDEKKRRQQQLAGAFALATAGRRNFVISKRKEDKFSNICQAKQEMEMTQEQQKEEKEDLMAIIKRSLEYGDLRGNDLKEKIRSMHQRICKLEAEKYDLERRKERQEYDLKELNERQRQRFRNNARKKGIDPASRYPPKILLLSKYEKQIDSRDFAERRAVFENKNAFPCFPNVPPPPTVYEKVVAPESGVKKSRKKPGKRKLTMFELYELCDALSPTSAHPKGTTLRDSQRVLDENDDPSAQIIDENNEGEEASEGEED